jgi:hypothetical protein
MTSLPPAIFLASGDISYPRRGKPFIGSMPNNPGSYITSPSILTTMQTQLFINDTMSEEEFDARIKVDPNYPVIIRLRDMRILVIASERYYDGYRHDGYHHDVYHHHVNKRRHADVVMFMHQGLADVSVNRFGECFHDFNIQRFTMYELLRASRSPGDYSYPYGEDGQGCCDSCNYPFYCDRCHSFSGMRTCFGCKCDCMCGCGIIDNQGIKRSSVHLPNCDNEYHNAKFIHRK